MIEELKARDRERWLSVLWAPREVRDSLLALHAYDLEQQRIVAEAKEPMLAEIRLAWWREQLEKLAAGRAAPGQPLLRALEAAATTSPGLDLAALTRLEEAFLPLLTQGPLDPLAMAHARGAALFEPLLGVLLQRPLTQAERLDAGAAGSRWALARFWRGGWGQAEARVGAMSPPVFPCRAISPLPAALRTLDALAAEDWSRLSAGKSLRAAASPGRQWNMLRAALSHR
ncbi:squalene/phytoene synthase family protein [Sandaracinobacteroides sayramensis]|uniref:squalene/phytoene synthase family protein n=1 Tax=Sandaracinobacteroides sayramensis TaxID=2913411 RepID=UPI001EDC2A0B|nr:squalene/phytoene synthase family protein [Sandaracinobacteroides sayramensis]